MMESSYPAGLAGSENASAGTNGFYSSKSGPKITGNAAPNFGGGSGGEWVYWSSGNTQTGDVGAGQAGSGVVILRMSVQASSTTGSPKLERVGDDYVYIFTGSGTLTTP